MLKLRKTPQAGGHKLSAKVNFIDLAGSEKVKKTGASGQRLKEAQSINAGLSTLSRVIEALAKKRQSIPFRDSVLTWILKDSLAGNTKTTLVITNSPHQFNKDETITTCRFGSRCKLIKTHVSSNKELTPQQMKALIKKLQKENLELTLSGGSMENEEIITNYKTKINELQLKIEQLRNDKEEKSEEEDPEKQELLEKIERLEAENGNLLVELESNDQEKRNLAVMNALLAEKLDKTTKEIQNEQAITELARSNLEYIKNDKESLLELLQDLRFNDEEAQEIYDNVFAEINKIAEELEDREQDLDELEEKVIQNETEIENKNYEISKLTKQLEDASRNKSKKGKNDKYDDDEMKYDDDTHSMNVLLNIGDQEQYLQDLADKEQELWEEREERAWRKYLNERAKEEGFKKGKDLLKDRRERAREQLKEGLINDVPEDEELLEDIRDDFYRLYDPATGQIREEDDSQYESDIIEDDEYAVDDPFEWTEEEVADWLKQQMALKKYSKQFKKENIDGQTLMVDLNKTNLKRDLAVKSVHVDKLMRGIQELRMRSQGYDEWKISQGIVDEVEPYKQRPQEQAYDVAMNGGNMMVDDEQDIKMDEEEEDFILTEEEKQFGEQFWGLDELFNILDIHRTGELDRAAFKHGLHALEVQLNDDDMDNVFRQIVNDDKTEFITYKAFIQYLQFTDFLGAQSQKYAADILAALPRVAANRKQYVTRAAMVIKYGQKYSNTKTEINNYLQNKGLQRAEIDAAWKQYRFNPKAIRDIDFKSLIGRKGKLIDMAIRDPDNVQPFDDFALYKLLKRAGFKAFGSKEFNDLDYLRAAGKNARIWSIKCWYDPQSQFFNGLQVIYECSNKEKLKGGRNMVRQGQYVEDEMVFQKNEILTSVTIYFAHFVCGVLFETDKRNRLFGSDLGRQATTLAAPQGTCLMAFYGSIGRLFETIGCYVVVTERNNSNKKNIKSGVQKLQQNKNKIKKSQRNLTIEEEEGDNAGSGGTTRGNTKRSKKNKKKKKQREYSDDDEYSYDD